MSAVRYTPFLDKHEIFISERLTTIEDADLQSAVNHLICILDSCLAHIESSIDWGEYRGKKRKPCPEQPLLLTGKPIGQYHCPGCGMMIIAAMPHISPAAPKDQHPDYPIDEYEREYQQPWPPGYEEGGNDGPPTEQAPATDVGATAGEAEADSG